MTARLSEISVPAMSLVPELKDQTNGVLLLDQANFISQALKDAFERLGLRVQSFEKNSPDWQESQVAERLDPSVFASLYYCSPQMALQQDSHCDFTPTWGPLKALAKAWHSVPSSTQEQIQLVVALPIASLQSPEAMEVFFSPNAALNKALVFACPPLWGFGDEALLDTLLSLHSSKDPSLYKSSPMTPLKTASVPDLVGLLLSAQGRRELDGKRLFVPAQDTNLESFRQAFIAAFCENKPPSWATKTLSHLLPSALKRFSKAQPASILDGLWEPSHKYFPTLAEPIAQGLSRASTHYQRQAEKPSHYPPARAP